MQGFIKRDRKRAPGSASPETRDVKVEGDPKRSTEWTLTEDAVSNGIQSTTRYRNKKQEKEAKEKEGKPTPRSHHHSFYHPSGSNSLRNGPNGNRQILGPRSRDTSSRVSKIHRHGMTSSSPFIARVSSPTSGSYYQSKLLNYAGPPQAQSIKIEPSLASAPDPYGMMMPNQNMLPSVTSAYDLSCNDSHGSPMYPPPQNSFPYGPADVHIGYPSADNGLDSSRPGRVFDITNMPDGLCDWSTSHEY